MTTIQKKIRSSGGHRNPSFVVSIPLQWCKILGLVKDSKIFLMLDTDRIILSMDQNQEDKKEVWVSLEQRLESRFE